MLEDLAKQPHILWIHSHPHPHPWLLLSDNRPQYVNKLTATMVKTYCISQSVTPYYSPQANTTERVNQVIKTISSYLGKFLYAFNTLRHSATGYTPAYLNLGRELKLPSLLDDSKETLDLDPMLPQ
jgi:hypothetical protein